MPYHTPHLRLSHADTCFESNPSIFGYMRRHLYRHRPLAHLYVRLTTQGFDEFMNLVLDDAEEVYIAKAGKETKARQDLGEWPGDFWGRVLSVGCRSVLRFCVGYGDWYRSARLSSACVFGISLQDEGVVNVGKEREEGNHP